MDPISSTGAGMIRAVSALNGASVNLSNAFSGQSGNGVATAAAQMAQARQAFQASTAALKTSQRTFKSLLDITV